MSFSDETSSRTKWEPKSMCLAHLCATEFWPKKIALLFSDNIVGWEEGSALGSFRRLEIHTSSAATLVIAWYSDSQLERTTVGCFLALTRQDYLQGKLNTRKWNDDRNASLPINIGVTQYGRIRLLREREPKVNCPFDITKNALDSQKMILNRCMKKLTNRANSIERSDLVMVKYWRAPTRDLYEVGSWKEGPVLTNNSSVANRVKIGLESNKSVRLKTSWAYLAWPTNKPSVVYETSSPRK